MTFPVPDDLSSELDAVNVLLNGIGEESVSSLENVQSSLVAGARSTLAEFNRMVQAKGWFWNHEENFKLSPNSEGEILVPESAIRVTLAFRTSPGDSKIIKRGRRLYDREERSYSKFTDPVTVDMFVYLNWDEMPEEARQAIVYKALRAFQMRELTSSAIDRVNEADVTASMTLLEQLEDDQGPHNQVHPASSTDTRRR